MFIEEPSIGMGLCVNDVLQNSLPLGVFNGVQNNTKSCCIVNYFSAFQIPEVVPAVPTILFIYKD
jgi:hypothetical protein